MRRLLNKIKNSKTFTNKCFGITAIGIGVVSLILGEGDATAFTMFSVIGIALFIAKENWIDL